MVDKKKKKSKRRTRKRISSEMIKIVVNNYLNNRDLRRQKRRKAQQKRNPLQRLGSAYPLQNKAIDAISYSNQFRHTNDIRLMALERGMSNALTANMTMLNDVIRHNKNLPLLDNKPHIPPPSNNYVENNNPNYPSSVVASSLDLDQDLVQEQKQEASPQLTALDRAVSAGLETDSEDEQPGLKAVQGDKDTSPLFTTPEQKPKKRATTTILQKVKGSETSNEQANILIELANGLGMENIARYVNSEGLVKKGQVGKFKQEIMTLQRKADSQKFKKGGGK